MTFRALGLRLVFASLLVVLASGDLPVRLGSAQTPASEPTAITIPLFLEDIRFSPNELEIPANRDVTLRIQNIGAANHSFVVEALDIDIEVESGGSAEITINAPAGDYSFFCSIPGHKEAGMVGTLRVVDGPVADPDVRPNPSATATETATSLPATPDVAMGAPACDGLDVYAEQVLAIETDAWNRLVAEFGVDEEYDLFLLDEADYDELAEVFDALTAVLMQVDAPAFAQEWHEIHIAFRQAFAATSKLVPHAGNFFAAMLNLWDVLGILTNQEKEAHLEATGVCPAFQSFVNELDSIDGDVEETSETVPDYSSCEGLEQYAAGLERATVEAFAHRPELIDEFMVFDEGGEEDLLALTPAELLMVAMMFREIGGEIAKVPAPDYASEWHLSEIMYFAAIADALTYAAEHGFESAEAEFGEQIGLAGILGDAAAEKGNEECPVFYEFATS